MKELGQLERLGYSFALDGDDIRYTHYGTRPPEHQVRPLLKNLMRHRDDLVTLLRERAALLQAMDDMDNLEWCQRWATIAAQAGWTCIGYDSWAEWLAEVESPPTSPTWEKDAVG